MRSIRAAASLLRILVGCAVLASLAAPRADALEPGTPFSDYAVDNWNVDSGLPQLSILSITQDHTGYLWIGTQNGIARFDGLRFEVYDRRSSNGIDTNDAAYSLVDRSDRIWFGTPHGALLFENNRFENVRSPEASTTVRGIVEMTDGTILFATQHGVLRYADHALVRSGVHDTASFSLLRVGESLWIGGVGAITRRENDVSTTLQLPADAAEAQVTRLAAAGDVLWIGTTVGLFRYADGAIEPARLDAHIEGKSPPPSLLEGLSIESLLVDRDGNLWIGTPSTMFRRRPSGAVERVRDEDFVRNAYVVSMFEDREGNLWLGSRTESLFRLWNGWARRISMREGLTDPLIWSVTKYDGKIVFGSNSNIVQLDDSGVHELVASRQLPNPAVYELNADAHGRLWIGTRSGLAIYENGAVTTPAAFEPLAKLQINTILPLPNEQVWLGTSGGLFRYRDGKLERHDPTATAAAARVRTIHVLTEDTVLIGTEDGIRRVHGDTVETPAWAKPLDGVFISSIKPIRAGLLGITTRDAGLALVSDDKLLMLTTEHGLPTDNGWSLEVVDGQLYVPTIDGIWRMPVAQVPDPAIDSARAVTAEIVLGRRSQRMHCCNGGARSRSLIDGSGLWFPAIQGAVRIETKAIVPPALPPTPVVEGLRHENRWYAAGTAIEIDSGRRDIELQFSGLSFRDPKHLHFRYRLEGYDSDWVEAGTRRSAFYTNLPPGQYRFVVQASLGPEIVSTQDGELSFYLVPRWYERDDVRVLLLLAALALAALGQWRMRERYRRRGLELEALVAQRTSELRRANELEHEANQSLHQANDQLRSEIAVRLAAEAALVQRNDELHILNVKLEGTQSQLLQSEKMASVGQLAAGVAHEINNPIGFVRSNLGSLKRYVHDIFGLLRAYEQIEDGIGHDRTAMDSVQALKASIELDYLREDTTNLLAESLDGITRVEKIVKDLKEFSHLDEAEWQKVDLHQGLESTLNVVGHELRYKAEVIKEYGNLPLIECLPFQINQVFLNLLVNAVHAIGERGTITLRSGCSADEVWVQIADTGKGIDPLILHRIFEPFFTTKPVGKGTGLGLSVSYGIIQKHGGRIDVASEPGVGTTFTIHLPIRPRRGADVDDKAGSVRAA